MRTLRLCMAMAALGLVSLIHPGRLEAATTKPVTAESFVQRMAQQGYREVTSGVLKRTREGNKADVIAFGRPGLEWALTQAQNRLGFFLKEYRRNPTPDGATALVEQNREIKRLERALAAVPTNRAGEYESFTNATCDFSYGATADAYALTASQGVGAVANAYFNNSSCSGAASCGYTAEVASYAYVSTRTGGTTTITFNHDPETGVKSGAAVTASSTLTQGGTADCYSEASSSVTVAGLGLYLSAYDSNSSCPVNDLHATIDGQTYVSLWGSQCQTVYWYANVTGGTPGYTYRWTWNGTQVGTGTFYGRTFCGGNYSSYFDYSLGLTVTDSQSRTSSDLTFVTVETSADGGCRDLRSAGVSKAIQQEFLPIC